MHKIFLKSGKEQSIQRFHPWIFSGAIKAIEGNPEEGDLVEIYSNKSEYLATGHYQKGSIAVRIVSFIQETIDQAFWEKKIAKAWQLRSCLQLTNNPDTNVYRLIHGEGDGMPGLIVDVYNNTAVMQSHSVGMYRINRMLAKIIKDVTGNITSIYDKSEGTLPFKAPVQPKNCYLVGDANPGQVMEYGNKFLVDWEEGQKTGFFIDQRENRKLLETYCNNKNVLNTFGYTGGFSVYALRSGANMVHTVDSSEKAIELTRKNMELNFRDAHHEGSVADVFEYLNAIDNKYDVIILDPPAFAKHQSALNNALQGYKKLNAKAISKIKPGGIIFTFSCSQVINKVHFREAVFSASAIAKRPVKILHQLTQPPDHPVNIYHPEGEYLKGLVLYVE
jgi:23S rRNA (cytosine1962-C5)-methyltransferase